VWHRSRAHRLFGDARWSGDALGLALVELIVAQPLPADPALTTAVAETSFQRSGTKLSGAAWHCGGAARGRRLIGFGNCCVIAGIVVQLSSPGPGDLCGLTDDPGGGEGPRSWRGTTLAAVQCLRPDTGNHLVRSLGDLCQN
jgi:hypothetical protein